MSEQNALKERLTALSKLGEYADFSELDWPSLATEVARLRDEKRLLAATSDVLQSLTTRLTQLQGELAESDAALAAKTRELGATQARREAAEALHSDTRLLAADSTAAQPSVWFERLDAMRSEALGEQQLTVESCDNREREMR
ncbi:MAG: ATP-dependent exonuclease SbcCD, C subunit-like protein, partial [Candidatus Accumulibacter sp.]|nr:ATP-dependent exonuclease SbcCD, C subunit-like protein [Accumulibacter sp.]